MNAETILNNVKNSITREEIESRIKLMKNVMKLHLLDGENKLAEKNAEKIEALYKTLETLN